MPKIIRPIRIEGDIAYVPLTRGYEAVIEVADVPLVDAWNWYANVRYRRDGTIRTIYAARKTTNKHLFLHRIILSPRDGVDVDHIDGSGLNNRRTNLRHATKRQNQHNSTKRCDNTSGFKGVSLCAVGGNWRARIKINGKEMSLGCFDTPEEAAAAYAEASAKYHGEFGRTE